eukprot:361775-Rhodomonas_salina.4
MEHVLADGLGAAGGCEDNSGGCSESVIHLACSSMELAAITARWGNAVLRSEMVVVSQTHRAGKRRRTETDMGREWTA